jgi:hypothetical protein
MTGSYLEFVLIYAILNKKNIFVVVYASKRYFYNNK